MTAKAPAAARVRLRDVTLEDADLLDAWNADPALGRRVQRLRLDARTRPIARRSPRDRCATIATVSSSSNGSRTGSRSGSSASMRSATDRTRSPRPGTSGSGCSPRRAARATGARRRHSSRRYLFDTTEVNRIEAQTDVDNVAEQRSLEKAGFVREGTIRGAQFRAGAYHDLVTYSILRDES